jgi:hypothetical protein
MRNFLFLITLAGVISCQPAKSDIYIETVNAALVDQMIKKATDTIWVSPDSSMEVPPVWVNGLKLSFSEPGTLTYIWYDEQQRITGLVEYQQNILKDSIQFFPNGQRMFSFLFNKKGRTSGPARFYYDDGRVREDGRFENGIKTGVWRSFKPDGKLAMVNEFDRFGNPKR